MKQIYVEFLMEDSQPVVIGYCLVSVLENLYRDKWHLFNSWNANIIWNIFSLLKFNLKLLNGTVC